MPPLHKGAAIEWGEWRVFGKRGDYGQRVDKVCGNGCGRLELVGFGTIVVLFGGSLMSWDGTDPFGKGHSGVYMGKLLVSGRH